MAFSSIQVVADLDKQELIFEALSNGVVVARHVLTGVDARAYAVDKELLVFADSKGALHAMDMGYVAKQAFKNPLPVFKKIYESLIDFSFKGELKASFLTRGLQPFVDGEVTNNAKDILVPITDTGEAVCRAGDFVLYDTEGTSRSLKGIFSRSVTYQKIKEGTAILAWLAFLVAPGDVPKKLLPKLLDVFNEDSVKEKVESERNTINPLIRDALLAFDPSEIARLIERSKTNGDLDNRLFDKFTLKEWEDGFNERREEAERQIQSSKDADRVSELQKEREELNYGLSWMSLTKKKIDQTPQEESSKLSKILNTKAMMILAGIATVGAGASIAYNLYPVESVQIINYIYANWIPPVLKDANYRMPLIYSTIALMLFIPEAMLVSLASIPGMKAVSKALAPVSKKASLFFKELHEKWGALDVWQRIVSGGMRFYAYLMYPFWNWIGSRIISPIANLTVKKGLKQENFFEALKSGQNPFEKIKADSELGRAVGLGRDIRFGTNNPLMKKQDRANVALQQSRALDLVAKQKLQSRSLAWLLATVIVSEKSGIDPATLLEVESGTVNTDTIEDLIKDPAKHKQWQRTTEAISIELNKLKTLGVGRGLDELSTEELAKYYAATSEVAEKLTNNGKIQNLLFDLKISFNKTSKAVFRKLSGFGLREFEFLRTVYANDFVSNQVKREFVTDHAIVVLLPAFWGERADLALPDKLSADPNGSISNLWTNGQHLYDIVLNTMAHLLVAGASTSLIYQGEPEVIEDNYRPEEEITLKSTDKVEGFMRGMFMWMKDVGNIPQSNVGGIIIKGFMKRFATMQAGLIMALTFRWLLAGQPIPQAIRGWLLGWFAGIWWYAWPWYPIQRGNQMEGQRFEEFNKKFDEAKIKISQGLRLSGSDDLLIKGYEELIGLYENRDGYDFRKEALKALAKVEKTAGVKKGESDLNDVLKLMLKEDAVSYYGILAKLVVSMRENNKDGISEAYELLVKVHNEDSGLTEGELRALNAESLLEFSINNPPSFTKPNAKTSWASVWIAAVTTTYMAISLSVASFEPDKLTNTYLLSWAALSGCLFTGSWILFSSRSFNFFADKVKRIKNYIGNKNLVRKPYAKILIGDCVELFAF